MEPLNISLGALTWSTVPESIAKIAGSLFTGKLGKAVVNVLEPLVVLAGTQSRHSCAGWAGAGPGIE